MEKNIIINCACRRTMNFSSDSSAFACLACHKKKEAMRYSEGDTTLPANKVCCECKVESTKHIICKKCFFRLYFESIVPVHESASSKPDMEGWDELSLAIQVRDANKEIYDLIREKIDSAIQVKAAYPYPPSQVYCPLNTSPHLPPSGNMGDLCKRYGLCGSVLQFAFQVPGFKYLSTKDQINLLSVGFFKVLFLRTVRLFDSHRGILRCLSGRIIRKDEVQGSYEENSLNSMFAAADQIKACNLTENEVGLLSAVMLMDPQSPWLEDRDSVAIVRRKLENVLCIINRPTEEIERIREIIPYLECVYFNHQRSYINAEELLEPRNKENIQPNLLEQDCHTPAASTGRSPAASTGRSPAATTGRSPAASTGRSPAGSSGRSPAASTGRSPAASSNRSPATSSGRSPGAASTGRSPAGSSSHSPSVLKEILLNSQSPIITDGRSPVAVSTGRSPASSASHSPSVLKDMLLNSHSPVITDGRSPAASASNIPATSAGRLPESSTLQDEDEDPWANYKHKLQLRKSKRSL